MTTPACALLTLLTISLVTAYRQLHFTNADVCDSEGETQTINTGEGALILSLTNNSYTAVKERKICNILIKAKSGYGLMVFAEDFRLRKNTDPSSTTECHDYIEFGREDSIPLWTTQRSGKLCGTQERVKYEDPDGQLLIWLQLGPASTPAPALSLVITPYSKKRQTRGSGYCECAGPWQERGTAAPTTEQWIRCQYFCDGRVNCALDSLPADEADVSCQEKALPPRTGGGLISGGTIREEPGATPVPKDTGWSRSRNVEPKISELSIGSIIVLALLALSLIACGILCTLKRCGPPTQGPSAVDNPNCPEQALSMVELVRLPPQTEENIYCPGPFQALTLAPASPAQEAPPPSYSDIFPPDYVPPQLEAVSPPDQPEPTEDAT